METGCKETKKNFYRSQSPTPNTCRYFGMCSFLHSPSQVTTFSELCLFCSFWLLKTVACQSFLVFFPSVLPSVSLLSVSSESLLLHTLGLVQFLLFLLPYFHFTSYFLWPTPPSSHALVHIHFIMTLLSFSKKACPQCKPWALTCHLMGSNHICHHSVPSSSSSSLPVHRTAQASHGMGGFLWQSASPLLAGTGPGTCYWLGVWKGSREVERGGEGGRKGNGVWEEGDRRGGGVVCSS